MIIANHSEIFRIKVKLLIATAIAYFALFTPPLSGETTEPTADSALSSCEFHIFPATEFGTLDITQSSLTQGIIPDLLSDRLRIKNPDDIGKFLRDTIPLNDEIAILKSIDYDSTEKAKNSKIIIHDQAHSGDYPTKNDPPIITNPPSCYKELVLIKFYFEKGTMHKGIRTAYSFRSFKDNKLSEKPKAWNVGVGISHFPPKDKTELEQAQIAVRNAYRANILEILNKK